MFAVILLIAIIIFLLYLIFRKKKNNLLILYLLIVGVYILLTSNLKTNFYVVRYILLYIILMIFDFIILKKPNLLEKIKDKKNKRIYFISMFIIYISLCIIPFENIYKKFETVEELFEYSYPNKKILQVFEGDMDTIILYDKWNAYFEKDGYNKYKFSVMNTSAHFNNMDFEIKNINENLKIIIRKTKNETKLVEIHSSNYLDSDNLMDSIDSKFYRVNNIYYTMVDYDINYYYVIIDGEKYEFDF